MGGSRPSGPSRAIDSAPVPMSASRTIEYVREWHGWVASGRLKRAAGIRHATARRRSPVRASMSFARRHAATTAGVPRHLLARAGSAAVARTDDVAIKAASGMPPAGEGRSCVFWCSSVVIRGRRSCRPRQRAHRSGSLTPHTLCAGRVIKRGPLTVASMSGLCVPWLPAEHLDPGRHPTQSGTQSGTHGLGTFRTGSDERTLSS